MVTKKNWKKSDFKYLELIGIYVTTGSQAFAQGNVGSYTLWNRGNTLDVSIAGCTSAFPESTASFANNPATMLFQPQLGALTFSVAHPSDSKSSSSIQERQSQDYSILGGAVKLGPMLAIGGGYQFIRIQSSSISENSNINSYKSTLLDAHGSIALGYKFFSLGFGIIDSSTKISSDTQTESKKESGNEQFLGGKSFQAGLFANLGGVVYLGLRHSKEQLQRPFSNHGDSIVKSAYQPEKNDLGIQFLVHVTRRAQGLFAGKFRILGQITQLKFRPKSEYPLTHFGDVLFPGNSPSLLNTKIEFIPRSAVESPVYRVSNLSFRTRVGYYKEPAFFENGKSRWHATFGATLRLWVLGLTFAIDKAKGFKNQSYGLGLDFEE